MGSPIYQTEDEWRADGEVIAKRQQRMQWQIADWLVGGRLWDMDLKKAAEIVGLSLDYLYQLRATAERFPLEKRRPDQLSFTSHKLIANYDLRAEQQEKLFQDALQHNWTSRDIEKASHAMRFDAEPRERTGHPDGYKHAQVQCPSCSHIFEIRGHKAPR